METLKSILAGMRFISAVGIWFSTVVIFGEVSVWLARVFPFIYVQVWGVVLGFLIAVYLGYLFFTKSIVVETWLDEFHERRQPG